MEIPEKNIVNNHPPLDPEDIGSPAGSAPERSVPEHTGESRVLNSCCCPLIYRLSVEVKTKRHTTGAGTPCNRSAEFDCLTVEGEFPGRPSQPGGESH